MSTLQNLTKARKPTDSGLTPPLSFSELTIQQQYWVDYCALQGLITNDDGSMKKMTIEECADQIGVTRQTLYQWKKDISNFSDLVLERCEDLFDGPRTVKMVNAIFLNGTSKMNYQAQMAWMANQKRITFRMPQQEIKHSAVNGWAALLEGKRKKDDGIIEGEVVSVEVATN